MEIGDWPTTAELNDIWRDAAKHDLVEHIAELEAFGFTVVPPEKVGPPELTDRLARALLDVHERRTGQRIEDLDAGSLDTQGAESKARQVSVGSEVPFVSHAHLLYEDRVYEEAVLNPAVYTLARYLLGRSVQLSDVNGLIKGQHADQIQRLHIDSSNTPPPFPPYPLICNVTWTLTDYTVAQGPVAIVPGSHRFGRGPMAHEEGFMAEGSPVRPIPIEAPKGSLIVWGGSTWHATFPRTAPGIRLTTVFVFSRLFVRPIQSYRRVVPPPEGMLERNPPELAELLGMRTPFPYDGAEPPTPEDLGFMRSAGINAWG